MKDITLTVLGCLAWLVGMVGLLILGVDNLRYYCEYGAFSDDLFYMIIPGAVMALSLKMSHNLTHKEL